MLMFKLGKKSRDGYLLYRRNKKCNYNRISAEEGTTFFDSVNCMLSLTDASRHFQVLSL